MSTNNWRVKNTPTPYHTKLLPNCHIVSLVPNTRRPWSRQRDLQLFVQQPAQSSLWSCGSLLQACHEHLHFSFLFVFVENFMPFFMCTNDLRVKNTPTPYHTKLLPNCHIVSLVPNTRRPWSRQRDLQLFVQQPTQSILWSCSSLLQACHGHRHFSFLFVKSMHCLCSFFHKVIVNSCDPPFTLKIFTSPVNFYSCISLSFLIG